MTAALPPPAERVAAASSFLRDIFADSEGWLVLWTLPDKASRFYKLPDELDKAAAEAVKLSKSHDVYFGVGLLREPPKSGRGTADDVSLLPGVWMEVDGPGPKDDRALAHDHRMGDTTARGEKVRFKTKDDALAFVKSLPVQPTMVVDSGHGYHCYWLFREAVPLADARAACERLQLFAIDEAKKRGVCIDSTFDPTRVLRVVETFNRKATPALRVKIFENDGPRHNLSEIVEHLPPISESTSATIAAADIVFDPKAEIGVSKLEALLENDAKFKRLWRRTRPGTEGWSASEWDMAVADLVAVPEYSDQEICDLLVTYRRKHGEKLKRADYYATTIETARKQAQQTNVPTASDAPLAEVRRLLQLPLAKIIRTIKPGEDPTFSFRLDDGQRVSIGGAETLRSQRRVWAIVAGTVKLVLPHFKADQWLGLVRLFLAACEDEQAAEDITEVGSIREILGSYFDGASVTPEGHESDGEHPFIKDGKLYFSTAHFRGWYAAQRLGTLTRDSFARLCDLYGIVRRSINVPRSKGGRSNKWFRKVPDDFDNLLENVLARHAKTAKTGRPS